MSAQVYDIYVYGQQEKVGKHFVVCASELDMLQILKSKLWNNLKLTRSWSSTITIGAIITWGAWPSDTNALYNNIRLNSPEQGFQENTIFNYQIH
jgi:hypothetical protein